MKEQVTDNDMYRIWIGLDTKYSLYVLTHEEDNKQFYEFLKGGESITELKRQANKHWKMQSNTFKI